MFIQSWKLNCFNFYPVNDIYTKTILNYFNYLRFILRQELLMIYSNPDAGKILSAINLFCLHNNIADIWGIWENSWGTLSVLSFFINSALLVFPIALIPRWAHFPASPLSYMLLDFVHPSVTSPPPTLTLKLIKCKAKSRLGSIHIICINHLSMYTIKSLRQDQILIRLQHFDPCLIYFSLLLNLVKDLEHFDLFISFLSFWVPL